MPWQWALDFVQGKVRSPSDKTTHEEKPGVNERSEDEAAGEEQ